MYPELAAFTNVEKLHYFYKHLVLAFKFLAMNFCKTQINFKKYINIFFLHFMLSFKS